MHAVVEVHGVDDVVILDLGSDSGTWVNGDRVRNRLRLSTGDRITIGRFNIVVTLARPKTCSPSRRRFRACGQSAIIRPGGRRPRRRSGP